LAFTIYFGGGRLAYLAGSLATYLITTAPCLD